MINVLLILIGENIGIVSGGGGHQNNLKEHKTSIKIS